MRCICAACSKHQQGRSVEALRLVAAALTGEAGIGGRRSPNYGVILDALKQPRRGAGKLRQGAGETRANDEAVTITTAATR